MVDYIFLLLFYLAGVFLAAIFARNLNKSWITEEDYATKFPTIFITLSWFSVFAIIVAVLLIYTVKNIFMKDGLTRRLYSKLNNWIQNANS